MLSSKELIKKRIMITGSNGRLGSALSEYYRRREGIELLCCSRSELSSVEDANYISLDISDKKKVKEVIKKFYPDVIINTASYTNVDACEENKGKAWKTNVTGVEYLLKYGLICDAHLIQISSDYIFDGTEGPYSEGDKPNPINYYGRTKLAAENLIRASRLKHTIIRTNVLFDGKTGSSSDFVSWVKSALENQKEIKVVTDQINNPTYIEDLVPAIGKVIEFGKNGFFNIGGGELISRFEFAERIAEYFKLNKSWIVKTTTEKLNQAAPRPLKSGLLNLKSESELGYRSRNIEEALKLIVKSHNHSYYKK